MTSPIIFLYANNASTTLAAPLTAGATTATLATGSGSIFPSPGTLQQFAMTFNDAATGLVYEIVYVSARSGDVVTIARGQEGTAATSWLAGDIAANYLTAGGANTFTQPATLQQQAGNYATDTGSANAYVATLNPAVATYADGLPLRFVAAHSNTGASTLNAGAGVVPLLRSDGAAVQGGDIVVGQVVAATYVSADTAFLITGALLSQINPATSANALAFQQGWII